MTLESEYLHGRRKSGKNWHAYYPLFSGLLIAALTVLVFGAGFLVGALVIR